MVLLALGTLAFVLVAWTVLYVAMYWLILLALSAFRGVDAQVPSLFAVCFFGSAAILCTLVFIARTFSPHERVVDRKSGLQIVADFVLAVPRATLSIWATLTARVALSEYEMACAYDLLRFVERRKRLDMQAVAQEIPDFRVAERVVIALQLAELIDLRRTDEGLRLMVKDATAARIAQVSKRIDLKRGRSVGAGRTI